MRSKLIATTGKSEESYATTGLQKV